MKLIQKIHPGDRIKDNDPRMSNRILQVAVVYADHGCWRVVACEGRRSFNIRMDRIHTDGKPRRSGFTLLPKP